MKVLKNIGEKAFEHDSFTLEPGHCIVIDEEQADKLAQENADILHSANLIGGEPEAYSTFANSNYIPIDGA